MTLVILARFRQGNFASQTWHSSGSAGAGCGLGSHRNSSQPKPLGGGGGRGDGCQCNDPVAASAIPLADNIRKVNTASGVARIVQYKFR